MDHTTMGMIESTEKRSIVRGGGVYVGYAHIYPSLLLAGGLFSALMIGLPKR